MAPAERASRTGREGGVRRGVGRRGREKGQREGKGGVRAEGRVREGTAFDHQIGFAEFDLEGLGGRKGPTRSQRPRGRNNEHAS